MWDSVAVRQALMFVFHLVQELRQKLSAVRGNHIISGMCDMWQGKTIRVPKLKPSLLSCDIIKVDYALMVSHG